VHIGNCPGNSGTLTVSYNYTSCPCCGASICSYGPCPTWKCGCALCGCYTNGHLEVRDQHGHTYGICLDPDSAICKCTGCAAVYPESQPVTFTPGDMLQAKWGWGTYGDVICCCSGPGLGDGCCKGVDAKTCAVFTTDKGNSVTICNYPTSNLNVWYDMGIWCAT
jgi:hypothetical protein